MDMWTSEKDSQINMLPICLCPHLVLGFGGPMQRLSERRLMLLALLQHRTRQQHLSAHEVKCV